MAQTILTRHSGFNPFFCNCKELNEIEFTAKGIPVGRINRGWFGVSNNHFRKLVLPFEVKIKRVPSLKIEAYLIKNADEIHRNAYKLVLPVEWLNGYSFTPGIEGTKASTYTMRYDKITFNLHGDRWEPVFKVDRSIEWIYTGDKLQPITAEINFRQEYNELGKKCNQLELIAKANGLDFNKYQFESLLKHFDITVK